MTLRHLGGPGFGLMSPARRSRIKRREVDRAGGINIENETVHSTYFYFPSNTVYTVMLMRNSIKCIFTIRQI